MRSSRRAAGVVAILSALAVLVTACATTPRVGAKPAAQEVGGKWSGGPGREQIDLGNGVRVYAYWNPGRTDVPWAINVHGGSWRYGSGDSGTYPEWAAAEQARGWAAFTVDYRLVPHVTWPGPEQDVQRAIRWVRSHASRFGMNPAHGFVLGTSAGGQLASIAALQLGGFLGAVDISGAVDPQYVYRHTPDRNLRGSVQLLMGHRTPSAAEWTSARAEHYLGTHVMPFLLLSSLHDPIVPYAVGRTFYRALRAHGYPARMITFHGDVHALNTMHDYVAVDRWMDGLLDAR